MLMPASHLTVGCDACSTMFLMGPLRQLSKMFEKGRIVATLVYIVFMFLTLFSAIKVCPHLLVTFELLPLFCTLTGPDCI